MNEYWLFVIDTDAYSGNFERQLTAWCTGQVGECGVGSEYAKAFEAAHPDLAAVYADRILHLPDDHGCHRPTAIYPTPGWSNDGGGHYRHDTTGRFPAYQSVAIFWHKQPDAEMVRWLIERALAYQPLDRLNGRFTVTGFRLLVHRETETVEAAYPVP